MAVLLEPFEKITSPEVKDAEQIRYNPTVGMSSASLSSLMQRTFGRYCFFLNSGCGNSTASASMMTVSVLRKNSKI